MTSAVDELRAEIERTTGVCASATALIRGLANRLDDAGDDPDELAELRDQLRASADQLAAAVTANPVPGELGEDTRSGEQEGTAPAPVPEQPAQEPPVEAVPSPATEPAPPSEEDRNQQQQGG